MSEKPNVVPFERDADFLRQRALKNQKDNHLIDALELMRKAVEAQPDNDEYRMELAQLLTEVGCPERSNREWLTLIYDPDNRGRCFYGMAMNQLAQGDTQTAQKLLNECIYHATGMEEAGRQLRDQIDLLEAMRIRPRRVRHIQAAVEKACLRLYAGDVGLARRSLRQILKRRRIRRTRARSWVWRRPWTAICRKRSARWSRPCPSETATAGRFAWRPRYTTWRGRTIRPGNC